MEYFIFFYCYFIVIFFTKKKIGGKQIECELDVDDDEDNDGQWGQSSQFIFTNNWIDHMSLY